VNALCFQIIWKVKAGKSEEPPKSNSLASTLPKALSRAAPVGETTTKLANEHALAKLVLSPVERETSRPSTAHSHDSPLPEEYPLQEKAPNANEPVEGAQIKEKPCQAEVEIVDVDLLFRNNSAYELQTEMTLAEWHCHYESGIYLYMMQMDHWYRLSLQQTPPSSSRTLRVG